MERFVLQTMQGKDAIDLVLDKLELKQAGACSTNAITRELKKYARTNLIGGSVTFRQPNRASCETESIDYATFEAILTRLGLCGVLKKYIRDAFNGFDPNNTGLIDFREFIREVRQRHQSRSIDGDAGYINGGHDNDAKRLRRRPSTKETWGRMSIDLEKLLAEKIEQKIGYGTLGLRRAFRDSKSGKYNSCVDLEEFQERIRRLGLGNMMASRVRALFEKHDKDAKGTIDFESFVNDIMGRSARYNSLDLESLSRECHKNKAKQLAKVQGWMAERNWRNNCGNIEKLVLRKLEEKTPGPRKFLAAFRRFDLASETPAISFPEFCSGIRSLGLHQINEEAIETLFQKYDTNGDGVISYREFANGLSRADAEVTYRPNENAVGSHEKGRNKQRKRRHRHCRRHCRKHERKRLVDRDQETRDEQNQDGGPGEEEVKCDAEPLASVSRSSSSRSISLPRLPHTPTTREYTEPRIISHSRSTQCLKF